MKRTWATAALLVLAIVCMGAKDAEVQNFQAKAWQKQGGDHIAYNLVASYYGNSGANGAGVDLTGTGVWKVQTTDGVEFTARRVVIEGAGVFSWKDPHGSIHRVTVLANSELAPQFIDSVFQATHATYPTTATGIHIFQ